MTRRRLGVLLMALVGTALAVSACVYATVSGSWKSDSYRDFPLSSVLVLGAGQNDLARRIYESDMVEKLRNHGVLAQSAAALFPSEPPVEKDKIIALAAERGIQTILITRVTRKKKETETRTYTSGNVYYAPHYYPYRGYPYYPHWYDYYGGFYGDTISTYTYEYVLLNLETNLYDIARDELIWATSLEAIHETDLTSTIKSINKVTLLQLQKDGVVKR